MSTVDGFDTGLLAPVRAGTAVAAAVSDEAWLRAMLAAETALARAQARLGAVPPDAARTITEVAAGHRFDVGRIARRSRGAANPVVALVRELTSAVAAVDPAAADSVHRGSTSQDILDTAAMLVARDALRLTRADLDRTAVALAALAEAHRDTAMPGRTLTQHAVPVTFGLKAAGWLQAVLDARHRLDRVLRDGLPVQLGGAAGTLAGYLEYGPADRTGYAGALIAAYAAELDLAEPVLPWHTVRTPIADLAALASFVTGALGKLAVDVLSLSRTEVAEVVEPAEPGRGGSSAMPHKRNPVLATLIRAAALQVPALAAVLAQCQLAEDERPAGAWQAEWEPLRDCLRLAGGAAGVAAELAEGLIPFPDRMRANLAATGGMVVTERVAAKLTPRLGKAAAEELVRRVSTRAGAERRPLADVIAEEPGLAGVLGAAELAELLDPTRYTGAAAELVDRVLRRYRESG